MFYIFSKRAIAAVFKFCHSLNIAKDKGCLKTHAHHSKELFSSEQWVLVKNKTVTYSMLII